MIWDDLKKIRRRFGLGVAAFFVLAACSKTERDFDNFRGEGDGTGGAAGGQGGQGGQGGATGGAPPVPCDGNDDPDCECVSGVLRGRDEDGDGERTRDCEAAPGDDCDDDDPDFVENDCGGCDADAQGVGDACQQCGVIACDGDDAVECSTPENKRRCLSNLPQLCVAGDWVSQASCSGMTAVCLEGNCVACEPGTFRCGSWGSSSSWYYQVEECDETGAWSVKESCSSSLLLCDAMTGTCTAMNFHMRDSTFEVPALLVPGVREEGIGVDVGDVLDTTLPFDFG